MNDRTHGEARYHYDRVAKTVSTGKKEWMLKDIPPHVIFGWIREGRIIKGVLEDWLTEKVFWKRTD